MVLMRGLSPNSATVAKFRDSDYIGKKDQQAVVVTGTKNVDRAFDRLFAPKRRRGSEPPLA